MGNVKHSYVAQNYFIQLAYENNAGLSIITEPYNIPKNSSAWIGSDEKPPRVAILWRKRESYFQPFTLLYSKPGLVAVKWGCYICIGIYQSPSSR